MVSAAGFANFIRDQRNELCLIEPAPCRHTPVAPCRHSVPLTFSSCTDGPEFEPSSTQTEEEILVRIRDRTKAALEKGITEMKEYAENDPKRSRIKSGGKVLSSWVNAVFGPGRRHHKHDESDGHAHQARYTSQAPSSPEPPASGLPSSL